MTRSQRHLMTAVVVVVLCSALAIAQRNGSRDRYTIAFKSFAPNNTDIFIAAPDGRNAHPLVPDPALDYNASFSRDGHWVVFTSHRSGSADVYRVRRDGSSLERLTDDHAFDDQGSLSPDGKSLAFVSTRNGQADIWTLDLTTRNVRNVITHPAGDFRPVWSPDGEWIAFSSDRNPQRTSCPNTTAPGPGPFVTPQFTGIYIAHPDGSGLRRISDPSELAGSPSWSPDGTRLAFHVTELDEVCRGGLIFGSGPSQVVSVDWQNGARDTLTTDAGLKVFARWAGSKRLAFVTRGGVAFSDGGTELTGEFGRPDWSSTDGAMVFHRDVDGRGDRDRDVRFWPSRDAGFTLLRVPGHASFSPVGDRFIYLMTNYEGSVRNGVLIVTNTDGSNRTAIYNGPTSDDVSGPAWSPTGDRILFGLGGFFQRAQIRTALLMGVRPDGTNLAPLTSGDTNDGMPSWAPDGRQLVLRVASGTGRGIYILNVETGQRRRLDTGSDYDTFPAWSPRGDWITFTSKRDDDYEVYRIRPDGTGLERLTRSPGADAHPSFSPDGEWIAFATGRQGFKDEAIGLVTSAVPPFQPYGEIAVMRADGTGVRMLTDNSTEEGTPVWVPMRRR